MALLFRIFLVGLLVYLVFRTIAAFGARTGSPGKADKGGGDNYGTKDQKRKGISKDVGEYVDYEEVGEDD